MNGFLKKYWMISLLVTLGAVFLFQGLSRPYLWQDEAETALLAKSIVDNGYPKAWDGRNLVTQLSGNDSNTQYTWSFTPWLPFYIVAASFKIFGETNFAGRFPFVLIGLLGLISLYLFVYQLSKNRMLAMLSSLFLLLNMQFVLYSRQCKYYSILFFIPPLLFLSYAKLKIGERDLKISGKVIPAKAGIHAVFVLCIVTLFYTNYLSLFTSLIGFIIYTFVTKRGRERLLPFVLAGIISLALTIPFFFIGDFSISSGLISRLPSIAEYADKLARHIWYFNNLVFGLVLFVPLVIFYKKNFFNDKEAALIRFLLWIIFPAWLFLPLFNQDVFRYNLQLLPLFCVLSALIVIAFFRWSKVWGVIFLILILTTNIFSNFPGVLTTVGLKVSGFKFEDKTEWVVGKFKKDEYKTRKFFQKMDRETGQLTFARVLTHSVLKSEYLAFYNELKGDYPDAIKDVVDFLLKNARQGQAVYSNFDLLPLQLYLPELKYVYVVDRDQLAKPKQPPLPAYITSLDDVDWYFFRDVKMNLGPYLTDEQFKAEMRERGKNLIPHDLGVSSLYWDINWPQRYYPYINKMLWRDEVGCEDVVIYEVR